MKNNFEYIKGQLPLKIFCRIFELSRATWYRNMKAVDSSEKFDMTTNYNKPKGAAKIRAYSKEHREKVRDEMNKPENIDLSISEIFAKWLDLGVYWGSIRTLYRILTQVHQF